MNKEYRKYTINLASFEYEYSKDCPTLEEFTANYETGDAKKDREERMGWLGESEPESFNYLSDALKAFESYETEIELRQGFGNLKYFEVYEYYLQEEEWEVDEDDGEECINGSEVLLFSKVKRKKTDQSPMNYSTFSRLYFEALDYKYAGLYVAERGWQDWMDAYTTDDDDVSRVDDVLRLIFELAHQPLKEMRIGAGFKTRTGFAREYHIPDRTVQAWEYGTTKMAEYNKALIAYTIFVGEELKNEQD